MIPSLYVVCEYGCYFSFVIKDLSMSKPFLCYSDIVFSFRAMMKQNTTKNSWRKSPVTLRLKKTPLLCVIICYHNPLYSHHCDLYVAYCNFSDLQKWSATVSVKLLLHTLLSISLSFAVFLMNHPSTYLCVQVSNFFFCQLSLKTPVK